MSLLVVKSDVEKIKKKKSKDTFKMSVWERLCATIQTNRCDLFIPIVSQSTTLLLVCLSIRQPLRTKKKRNSSSVSCKNLSPPPTSVSKVLVSALILEKQKKKKKELIEKEKKGRMLKQIVGHTHNFFSFFCFPLFFLAACSRPIYSSHVVEIKMGYILQSAVYIGLVRSFLELYNSFLSSFIKAATTTIVLQGLPCIMEPTHNPVVDTTIRYSVSYNSSRRFLFRSC